MKYFLLSLSIIVNLYANTAIYLAPHNCEVGKQAARSMGHAHGGEQTAMYQVVGMDGSMSAKATYILSNLEEKPLSMNANLFTLCKSMYGNYHALVVNGSKENMNFTAITYVYKNGKPSKISPSKLTASNKGMFEISPDPLPREHDRYTANKTYSFILKWDNKPLANTTISLIIDNNTTTTLKSDHNGRFEIVFPDNFENVFFEKRGNKPKEFVLSSQTNQNNQTYLTSLRGEYHINPINHWQSIPAGIGVLGFGFLIGLLVYRRVKNG